MKFVIQEQTFVRVLTNLYIILGIDVFSENRSLVF